MPNRSGVSDTVWFCLGAISYPLQLLIFLSFGGPVLCAEAKLHHTFCVNVFHRLQRLPAKNSTDMVWFCLGAISENPLQLCSIILFLSFGGQVLCAEARLHHTFCARVTSEKQQKLFPSKLTTITWSDWVGGCWTALHDTEPCRRRCRH